MKQSALGGVLKQTGGTLGTDLFLRPLFDWRSAIASDFGPPNPTTRHVLLTLSLHMSAKGDSCFPSIELLVRETGLSRRAVITHLQAASQAGWVGKQERPERNGQGWRRVEYFSLIPNGVEEQLKAEYAERGAGRAPRQGGASGAQGGAPDDTKVVHQVHLSTSKRTSKSTTPLLGADGTPHTPEFETAFKAYPKRAGNNPKHDAWKAYRARLKEGVTDAQLLAGVQRYAAWCTATGKVGTEYVMRASTFFGTGKAYDQGFPVTEDVTKGPKLEPRCIHIPEGQGASQRCMAPRDVALVTIEVQGARISIGVCHKHYGAPVKGPDRNLVMNPEMAGAIERFKAFANDRLVPA